MKKRAALYAIYCCVVILVLASCLVVKVHAQEPAPAERATSLRLNTPREITITTNKVINLLPGFIFVEPENAIDLMEYSISSSSTTKPEYLDFDFDAKTFVALKTGYYYITFTVPKNSYSNWRETLKIHAVADTQQDFKLKTNQITIGQTKNFDEIFEQTTPFEYKVELNNNNLDFSDGAFHANSQGVTKVCITITRGYVRYTNEYEIHVEKAYPAQPEPEGEGNTGEEDDSGKGENQGGNQGEQPGGEEAGGESGNPSGGEGEVGGNQGETGGNEQGGGADGEQSGGQDDEKNGPSKDEGNKGNEGGQTGGNQGSGSGQTGGNEEEKGDGSGEEQGSTGGESGGEIEQQPQEKFELKVEYETDNSSGVCTIHYEILLGSVQHVSQQVLVTVSDPTIAKLTGCFAPFINLQILKSGSFTLTLTLVDNPEISFSINITV